MIPLSSRARFRVTDTPVSNHTRHDSGHEDIISDVDDTIKRFSSMNAVSYSKSGKSIKSVKSAVGTMQINNDDEYDVINCHRVR